MSKNVGFLRNNHLLSVMISTLWISSHAKKLGDDSKTLESPKCAHPKSTSMKQVQRWCEHFPVSGNIFNNELLLPKRYGHERPKKLYQRMSITSGEKSFEGEKSNFFFKLCLDRLTPAKSIQYFVGTVVSGCGRQGPFSLPPSYRRPRLIGLPAYVICFLTVNISFCAPFWLAPFGFALLVICGGKFVGMSGKFESSMDVRLPDVILCMSWKWGFSSTLHTFCVPEETAIFSTYVQT